MAARFVLSSFSPILMTQRDDIETIGQSIPIPKFSQTDLMQLNIEAMSHFKYQPSLLQVTGQSVIVGDIHGNLFDLLTIFSYFSDFSSHQFIFLGDYVDRGDYSIEVITLLFALAIVHPTKFILIRGNHEFYGINETYGFRDEIMKVYGNDTLWHSFNKVFDFLPIACVLDQQVFCVHGGISPALDTVSQIGKLMRPIDSFEQDLIRDLMWADPSETSFDFSDSKRGAAHDFGSVALVLFLQRNKLKLMVRGHQFVDKGIQKSVNGHLITVFSASNYEDTRNTAAVLIYISANEYHPFSIGLNSFTPRISAKFVTIASSGTEKVRLLQLHSPQSPGVVRRVSRPDLRVYNSMISPQKWVIQSQVSPIRKVYSTYQLNVSNSMVQQKRILGINPANVKVMDENNSL